MNGTLWLQWNVELIWFGVDVDVAGCWNGSMIPCVSMLYWSVLSDAVNSTGRENLIIAQLRLQEELIECQSHCGAGLKASLRKSWGRSHRSIHGRPCWVLMELPGAVEPPDGDSCLPRDRETPHRDSISAGGQKVG